MSAGILGRFTTTSGRRIAAACAIVAVAASIAAPSQASTSASSTGGFIAFDSSAPLGQAVDTNGSSDAFVWNEASDTTTRISNRWTGGVASGASSSPSIAAGGAWVAFTSASSNLVPSDKNPKPDVFVAPVSGKGAVLASVGPKGAAANGVSGEPSISGDGRIVAFTSLATNLVKGDGNRKGDVFVYDAKAKLVTLVSRGLKGKPANGVSSAPQVSANGRVVVFTSTASNLVKTDKNGKPDVFTYDVRSRKISLASRPLGGKANAKGANGASSGASVSADGAWVTFTSNATNLDKLDTKPGVDAFVAGRAGGPVKSITVNKLGTITDARISGSGAVLLVRTSVGTVHVGPRASGKLAQLSAASGSADASIDASGAHVAVKPTGLPNVAVRVITVASGAAKDVLAATGSSRAATGGGTQTKPGNQAPGGGIVPPVVPGGRGPTDPTPGQLPAIEQPALEVKSHPGANLPASPDPAGDAPEQEAGAPASRRDANEFLYTGADAVQKSVDASDVSEKRVALAHGRVVQDDGADGNTDPDPVSGVKVSVLGQTDGNTIDLGYTTTQADGSFDMVVNGGGELTFSYDRQGFLPVQRTIDVPWQGDVVIDDVHMTELSSRVAELDVSAASGPTQVALGEATPDDGAGARQPVLMVDAGTKATGHKADGSTINLDESQLELRATEYTVGASGPDAMPGDLPAASAYTYAVDFTVDQALEGGAVSVTFDKPLVNYMENFLGFPTGTTVPTGYYDREDGQWKGSKNGRVIEILAETDGASSVDTNGDGIADTGTNGMLTIDLDERKRLAQLYEPGAKLWRVEITHFSPWDHNFPYLPAPGARPPAIPQPDVEGAPNPPDPCSKAGSIIGCQNQTLGERLDIDGTPYSLAYDSSRVPGGQDSRTFDIPLKNDQPLPSDLSKVTMTVSVGGQVEHESFTRAEVLADPVKTFTWNGKDAFDRPLYGSQRASVFISYEYPLYYAAPANFSELAGPAFAAFGDTTVFSVNRNNTTSFTLDQSWSVQLEHWDATALEGIGSWNVDVHHAYDVDKGEVKLGTGETRSAEQLNTETMTTIAGDGSSTWNPADEGGQALNASANLERMTVAADGSIWYVWAGDVRRIDPDGTMHTVASDSAGAQYSEIDVPFNKFSPGAVFGIAVAPNGEVYIAGQYKIWRLGLDGKANVVFGKPRRLTPPDPADPCTAATANLPTCYELPSQTMIGSMALEPDGSLLVGTAGMSSGPPSFTYNDATGHNILRVLVGASVSRVVGTGAAALTTAQVGEGNQATSVKLARGIGDIAVAGDGTIYFTMLHAVYRVGRDGIVNRVVGTGADGTFDSPAPGSVTAANADGALATDLGINPQSIALHGDLLYVADAGRDVLIEVDSAGRMRRVAGDAAPSAGNTWDFTTEGDNPRKANLGREAGITGLEVMPDGVILAFDSWQNQIRRIGPTFPRLPDGQFRIPSPEGDEVWVFDKSGRHLATDDAMTNVRLLEFAYGDEDGDADDGKLTSIEDANDRRTTFTYGASSVTITAPDGKTSHAGLDTDGLLTTFEDASGGDTTLGYQNRISQLLTSLTTPKGVEHTYAYDTKGRLTSDAVAGGATTTLVGSNPTPRSRRVVVTKGGAASSYEVERLADGTIKSTRVGAGDQLTVSTVDLDGVEVTTSPDGTVTTVTTKPDPWLGAQAPFASRVVQDLPGSHDRTIVSTREMVPLTPGLEDDQRRYRTTIGVNTTERLYKPALPANSMRSSIVTTSPTGRTTEARSDTRGRPVWLDLGTGLDPVQFTYVGSGDGDAHGDANVGKVRTRTQGASSWTYAYDAEGNVASKTDAENHTVAYGYDDSGRVTSINGPEAGAADTRHYTYDADGNRTGIELPGNQQHTFSWDAAGRFTAWTAPAAGGVTDRVLERSYDSGDRLASTTLPGDAVISEMISGGRRTGSTIGSGGGVSAFTFGTNGGGNATDQIVGTTRTGFGATTTETNGWDGLLPTSVATSTPGHALSADLYWDSDHRFLGWSSIDATGGASASQTRSLDADGKITQDGPFTVARANPGGAASSWTAGNDVVAVDRDVRGRGVGRSVNVDGAAVEYDLDVTRDDAGRITRRDEVLNGVTTRFDYTYDASGRLTEVKRNTTTVEEYTWDAAGNRSSVDLGTLDNATHDAQGRLLTQGANSWTYDDAGFATSARATALSYTAGGELKSVTGGSTYGYDASGRRTSQTFGGDTRTYLYANPVNPFELTASRAEDGTLTTYVYDEDGLLISMRRGATTYLVASDQVGTPRAVYETNGTLVETFEYDAFGVRASGAPTFQMDVGFAGGLIDPTTDLVHFGMRDYDPVAGRFLARDPSWFTGSPDNLYAYAGGDPIGMRDPTGLTCIGASYYVGAGAGFQICHDENGWSSCIEGGFGLGGGIEVNPWGASGTDSDSYFGEIGTSFGAGGGSLGFEVDANCKTVKVGGKVGAGGASVGAEYDFGGAGLAGNIGQSAGDLGEHLGFKSGGKVGRKVCKGF